MGWRKPKPFQCVICGRDFQKETQLKKHVKDSHGIEYQQYKENRNDNSGANREGNQSVSP